MRTIANLMRSMYVCLAQLIKTRKREKPKRPYQINRVPYQCVDPPLLTARRIACEHSRVCP